MTCFSEGNPMTDISDIDKHWLDPFLKVLANPCLIFVFALCSFFIGLVIAILTKDWSWVSRASSLITIAGLLLTMSPTFMKGVYLAQSQAGRLAGIDSEGKTITTSKEEREIGRNVAYGIILTILGTILWGFGDLICAAIFGF